MCDLDYDIYYDEIKYNHDDYITEIHNINEDNKYYAEYIRGIIKENINVYRECMRYINDFYDDDELIMFYNMGILNNIMLDNGVGTLECFNDSYDYDGYIFKNTDRDDIGSIIWECIKCGQINHMYGNKRNLMKCSKCEDIYVTKSSKSKSRGEKLIRKLLQENNKEYEEQYPITGSNGYLLKFDFMVIHEGIKYFIEVNGRQHYEPIKYFGGEKIFKRQVINDTTKKEYAMLHGIYIELNYSENDLELLEDRFYNNFYNKYIAEDR